MAYYYSKITELPFAEAVARTREALKDQGFGIITEIDVTETFKQKLDVAFRPRPAGQKIGIARPGFDWSRA